MQCELLDEQFCTPMCIPNQLAIEAHRLVVRHLWLSVKLLNGTLQFSSALPMVELFQEFSPFGCLIGIYCLGDIKYSF